MLPPKKKSIWWLLLAAGIVTIVITVSSLTYLFVERPMQNLGRRVGHWLDARFGPDRLPAKPRAAAQPAMAGRSCPATE